MKIIISILAILLLIFLLFNLYSTFSKKDKLEKAEAQLDRLKGMLSTATEEEIIDTVKEPKSWLILFYKAGEESPNACAGQNCLCVCEEEGFWGGLGIGANQIEKCEDVGICKQVSMDVELIDDVRDKDNIKIDGAINIAIKKEGGKTTLTRVILENE